MTLRHPDVVCKFGRGHVEASQLPNAIFFLGNEGSYCGRYIQRFVGKTSWIEPAHYGATIRSVKEKPAAFTRRKFSAVVRKGIISYYTEQEKLEIAQAAKREGVSMSSFIASAALKEAWRASRKSPLK